MFDQVQKQKTNETLFFFSTNRKALMRLQESAPVFFINTTHSALAVADTATVLYCYAVHWSSILARGHFPTLNHPSPNHFLSDSSMVLSE